ncbi:IclR family transcriptional regulator [Oerskovia flava]|uniref:IclR family transcriptional regulator n=1 Tax=Oerskovia flava TaxID=2986422 RepID=UPI00223FBE5E|nr:IclR family transcriptional regulator [Oerskovia sp. JB1-3-2]
MTEAGGDASPLGSVDKALRALEELAAAGPGGLPLGTLASRLDLNKASLHRTLAALRFRGFTEQDPVSGSYRLGQAATALATVYLGEENLPALLEPALRTLCAATDELVHLGALSGTEIVYLDKIEPARAVRVWSAVGRRRPAATTALGRALLAHRDLDEAALAWYAPDDAVRDTLRSALSATRERGFATETEENEPGISCLAVPVLRGGQAVAALSVTAPAERMGPERHDELRRIVATQVPATLPPTLAVPAELGDAARPTASPPRLPGRGGDSPSVREFEGGGPAPTDAEGYR